jgi:hypothetical protein
VSGVQVNNQFGAAVLDVRKEAELCVPSEKGGVDIAVDIDGGPVPGAALGATVTISIGNGDALQSILWEQVNHSVTVTIDNATSANATVNLPAASAYKDELFTLLAEPPLETEEPYHGGIQDRFQVVGLTPLVLEETALVTVQVTVTTSSGTYTEEVDIHTHLPWKVATGLRDVPVGAGVLLHGKDGITPPYDWTLVSQPIGSTATLTDATAQNPDFTPDVEGLYEITVTDTNPEPDEVVTLQVYAGTWLGVITGKGGDGLPLADGCAICHNDSIAPDMITPWRETGHAHIFSTQLDTSTHYGPNCFGCHTVGFDPDVDNNGIDEAADYAAFLASGLINNPGDNWTTVVASYPETAKLANIQCENCHGPNSNGAHGLGDPRTSLSSDVCATCHGEPLRHARFQQWQLSGHANYELAIDESQRDDCSRCHTGNGFLAWEAVAYDAGTNVTVEWTEDETHPQTCVTCHDPHDVGTSSGGNTNATGRVSGDTPALLAGFTATDVGKGAICMICHNSRRGLRNDSVFAGLSVSDRTRAPHAPAMTDVLMGENAYFVTVGTRGSHGNTANPMSPEDTCVTCHMEATPPPPELSYNLGGTNHVFTASPDICSDCHGFGADVVQPVVDSKMNELKGLIEAGLLGVMADQIALGNHIDLGAREVTDTADVADLEFGESRGRQDITVTFTAGDPLVVTARMNAANVHDAAHTDLGLLYDPLFSPDALVKSGWNYGLVHNDLSRGVHNPAWVFDVLDASIAALTP